MNNNNDSKWAIIIITTLLTILSPIILQYVKRTFIRNELLLPIKVVIDSKDQGILQPHTQDYFFFENLPGQLNIELMRNVNSEAEPIGEFITWEYKRLRIGSRLVFTAPSNYFFPIITNNLDEECEAFVNRGLMHEKRIGIVAAGYSDFSTGYFPLYTNSNVTFYCGSGTYFWGILEGSGSSLTQDVMGNGTIILKLEKEITYIPTAEIAIDECYDSKPTRLTIGSVVFVSYEPPTPNRVRSLPGKQSPVVGKLFPGDESIIVDGPICKDGWRWWKVNATNNNFIGWTSEGDINDYWLVPK